MIVGPDMKAAGNFHGTKGLRAMGGEGEHPPCPLCRTVGLGPPPHRQGTCRGRTTPVRSAADHHPRVGEEHSPIIHHAYSAPFPSPCHRPSPVRPRAQHDHPALDIPPAAEPTTTDSPPPSQPAPGGGLPLPQGWLGAGCARPLNVLGTRRERREGDAEGAGRVRRYGGRRSRVRSGATSIWPAPGPQPWSLRRDRSVGGMGAGVNAARGGYSPRGRHRAPCRAEAVAPQIQARSPTAVTAVAQPVRSPLVM